MTRVLFDTVEGEQEMPPEVFAQAFEDWMLARFYSNPDDAGSKLQARNLRNHLYRFLIEPIRIRTEVDPAVNFAYMNKADLIRIHGDLGYLETYVMKRASNKGIRAGDDMTTISEAQELVERLTNELP